MTRRVRFPAAVAPFVLAAAALADEPRGPEFGNSVYVTAIRPISGEKDVDDYVGSLAAGETLSVDVSALKKSELKPSLVVLDPDGVAVDAGALVRRGGKAVLVKAFTVPRTGLWTVRVGAASDDGDYAVRFKVKPAKPARLASRHLGGADPITLPVEFEAVGGSALTLTLKSGKGGVATPRLLVDPSGTETAISPEAFSVRRGTVTLKNLPLAGASGTWRLDVGVDSGETTFAATVAVLPPATRPVGSKVLADEPRLTPLGAPMDGIAGQVVQLQGTHFPAALPYAKVWIGGKQTNVAAVGAGGTSLFVVAPDAPGDTVADVTVQNPDGQTTTRAEYFHYVPQGPLDVLSIDPSPATVLQGGSLQLTVKLTRVVKAPGIDLVVEATGGMHATAPSVHVPGGFSSVSFTCLADAVPSSGTVKVTYVSTVTADVEVVPPATLVGLSPTNPNILENQAQTFTVSLSSAAPTGGLDAAVTVVEFTGTPLSALHGPTSVHIPGGKATATFSVTAGAVRTTGDVSVRMGVISLYSHVSVVAPPTIDLTGWTIVQTNPSITFTIPSGTVLNEGDCIVIGRNATKTDFTNAWRRTWDGHVHYFDGTGNFPVIDGGETYQLKNAAGASVDGPTIPMAAGANKSYVRVAGTPNAGSYSSWLASTETPWTVAMPGVGNALASTPAYVYVCGFTAASGHDNYQYVEIFFDRIP